MTLVDLTVRSFAGEEAAPYLGDLARLRVLVFREWPYLYDGSLDHEHRYLQSYLAPGALVVVAFDGDRIVGAATGLPLVAHADAGAGEFVAAGLDASTVFYFGESMLLPEYRGRGIGHRFFDEREAFAARGGFRTAAFAAIERPDDHPMRRNGARTLGAFWRGRGYVRQPELQATFRWKDLGQTEETAKSLIFWLKELSAVPRAEAGRRPAVP